MPEFPFFRDLVLAVGAALVGGVIAQRLGQPPLLGYLLGGILIGPYTPGPVSDKPVGPPAVPPERSPTASEIFVRMIDGSGPVPEAMVSVGPASYVVRAGDPIGAWQVAAIGPNGIWIKAGPSERVWRPLLARGSIPAEPWRPSSGVPAAPPAAASP